MEWKPDRDLLDQLYDPRAQDYPPKPAVWAMLSQAEAGDIVASLGVSTSSEKATRWDLLALDEHGLIVVEATSDEFNWCWESRDVEHSVTARRIPKRRIFGVRVTKVQSLYRGGIAPTASSWAAEHEIQIEDAEAIALPSAIAARDQHRRDEIENFWTHLREMLAS